MADATAAQKKLELHVVNCQACRNAKYIGECCQVGRILARLVESISTQ